MENFQIDINQHETMIHGSEEFPCMWYVDQYWNNAYPWHWHDELEVAMVQKGILIVGMNGQKYVLQKGDSIFVNSCTLHSYEGEKNIETVFPNILFQRSLLSGNENSVFHRKYIGPILEHTDLSFLIFRADTEEGKQIASGIERIGECMQKAQWGYEFEVRNQLSQIFLCIMKRMKDIYGSEERIGPKNLQRTRQMIDYIQSHYMENITLQQIAQAASISTRECMRCFQNTIGVSPKQYLIGLRIRKACRLLTESNLPLVSICESCGFQDQSYFTRLFHREMGCSPGRYRKEQWKTLYCDKRFC